MFSFISFIVLCYIESEAKVAPINQAYFVADSNSFVVTCRLSEATKEIEPSTCDILIDLHHVPDPSIFTGEQWVLIRANQAITRNLGDHDASSPKSRVMDKLSEFPETFNIYPECSTLRWHTHYSEQHQELQIRILMSSDFQETMLKKKCHLFPWSMFSPVFLPFDLSFTRNYIEIRFSPHEIAITPKLVEELKRNVEWPFVSMEVSHIYTHFPSSSNTPTYYMVTDITDGHYRWYVDWDWRCQEVVGCDDMLYSPC